MPGLFDSAYFYGRRWPPLSRSLSVKVQVQDDRGEKPVDRLNHVKIVTPDPDAIGEGGIRYFFAEVGSSVFEVMRAEESGP